MIYERRDIRQAVRFRRFVGSGWAAFASMHREVTIGRLSAAVADMSMQKMGEGLQMMESAFWCGLMGEEEAEASMEEERLTALVVPACAEVGDAGARALVLLNG